MAVDMAARHARRIALVRLDFVFIKAFHMEANATNAYRRLTAQFQPRRTNVVNRESVTETSVLVAILESPHTPFDLTTVL